jgi:hypothetical protein
MENLPLARLSLVLVLASSCQSNEASSGGSVCPACEPQVGGETGDFGGSTVGVCGGVARRVVIDAAQASALGFDIAEIERRLAQPIDASLQWVVQDDDGGDAPTGFARETRVHANIAITGYGHNRPDPEFCDGTVCTLDGATELQATCAKEQFLDLALRVNFRTDDGAVRGTAMGHAVQWGPDSRSAQGNPALPVQVVASVNLLDVTGSLRLYPTLGRDHYHGQLEFSAELLAESYQGAVFPSVFYDAPQRMVWYAPLVGHFPATSVTAQGAARPEVDAGPGDRALSDRTETLGVAAERSP